MNKLWFKISSVVITFTIIVGASLALSPKMRVSASNDFLSISVGDNVQETIKLPEITHLSAGESFAINRKSNNNYEIVYDGTASKVTIGSGTSTFNNKINFSKWGGESQFYLDLPRNLTGALGNAVATSTSLNWENSNYAFTYSPVGIKEGFNDEGGLDLSITVKKKPAVNSLSFNYSATLVDAFFQPALTQAEIDEGCIRPDYVVNSIAFYSSTKGGMDLVGGVQYKTGKVGHLYRMKATDAKGNWVWTDWSIGTGTIILTVSQSFLNTATYPIVIAPVGDTFGYTGAPATENYAGGDDLVAMLGTPTSSGTVDSVTVWWGKTTDEYIKAVIVLGSNKNIVTDGVGGSVHITNYDKHQETMTYTSKPSVTASTNYYVGWVSWYGAGRYYYDNGTGLGTWLYDTSNPYDTPTNPTDGSDITDTRIGAYATYTAAASYDITETTTSKAMGILAVDTTYWANGHTPDNPLADDHCTFTLTNNAVGACDIDIKMADFTNGVGWNIEETANPAADEVQINAYISGSDPTGAGLLLKNADQEFKDNMAGSSHFHWDFKMLTGTSFTDGVAKSGVLTMTARVHT